MRLGEESKTQDQVKRRAYRKLVENRLGFANHLKNVLNLIAESSQLKVDDPACMETLEKELYSPGPLQTREEVYCFLRTTSLKNLEWKLVEGENLDDGSEEGIRLTNTETNTFILVSNRNPNKGELRGSVLFGLLGQGKKEAKEEVVLAYILKQEPERQLKRHMISVFIAQIIGDLLAEPGLEADNIDESMNALKETEFYKYIMEEINKLFPLLGGVSEEEISNRVDALLDKVCTDEFFILKSFQLNDLSVDEEYVKLFTLERHTLLLAAQEEVLADIRRESPNATPSEVQERFHSYTTKMIAFEATIANEMRELVASSSISTISDLEKLWKKCQSLHNGAMQSATGVKIPPFYVEDRLKQTWEQIKAKFMEKHGMALDSPTERTSPFQQLLGKQKENYLKRFSPEHQRLLVRAETHVLTAVYKHFPSAGSSILETAFGSYVENITKFESGVKTEIENLIKSPGTTLSQLDEQVKGCVDRHYKKINEGGGVRIPAFYKDERLGQLCEEVKAQFSKQKDSRLDASESEPQKLKSVPPQFPPLQSLFGGAPKKGMVTKTEQPSASAKYQ